MCDARISVTVSSLSFARLFLCLFCKETGLDLEADASHHADMLIFKIFHDAEWADLQTKGETLGAPVDLADGFVHFSTATQVAETAAKHFAGAEGLWLLAFEADDMGDALKWEVSRGGAEFPHLYRSLRLDEVLWAKPLPVESGMHQFPAEAGV